MKKFILFLALTFASIACLAEATLYERMSGDIGENDSRIPIHGIRAMVGEIDRGILTQAFIVDQYSLTIDQEADLDILVTKMLAKKDKAGFSQFLFDWLALAELGVLEYKNETEFWLRVDDGYN